MKRIPVGILGATGMVGQQYIRLLADHPWFRVAYVAASPQSAGKKYRDALKSGWIVAGEIPADVASLTVQDVADVKRAARECTFVFSAFEMPDKDMVRKSEEAYAAAGMPVFSNASAHRHTSDVPMLIPEINAHHLDIIPLQQKARGWEKGFIVVKPNCSIQSYIAPIHALLQKGYDIKRILVTTMQAVSGAGYPGVS
ncbi:MAG: aspartate-semialdehyde dehydrogenase, partial [bacterium]|nr:aspartate-semialdehyde dehydrogenase [bacterium]